MKICREFFFDAAHTLPNYRGKCANLHGHTYKLEVVLSGDVDESGMVVDFTEVKKVVNRAVVEKLDHSNLNEMFRNPTAETMAVWIFGQIKKEISQLCSVRLWEGKGSWVEYDGEGDRDF